MDTNLSPETMEVIRKLSPSAADQLTKALAGGGTPPTAPKKHRRRKGKGGRKANALPDDPVELKKQLLAARAQLKGAKKAQQEQVIPNTSLPHVESETHYNVAERGAEKTFASDLTKALANPDTSVMIALGGMDTAILVKSKPFSSLNIGAGDGQISELPFTLYPGYRTVGFVQNESGVLNLITHREINPANPFLSVVAKVGRSIKANQELPIFASVCNMTKMVSWTLDAENKLQLVMFGGTPRPAFLYTKENGNVMFVISQGNSLLEIEANKKPYEANQDQNWRTAVNYTAPLSVWITRPVNGLRLTTTAIRTKTHTISAPVAVNMPVNGTPGQAYRIESKSTDEKRPFVANQYLRLVRTDGNRAILVAKSRANKNQLNVTFQEDAAIVAATAHIASTIGANSTQQSVS